MSRFFDEMEDRLRASAADLARDARESASATPATGPAGRPGRRRLTRRHRRLLIAAVVVLAALAGSAAAAVTTIWRPDVKPRPAMKTVTAGQNGHGYSFSCPSPEGGRRVDIGPPVGAAFTSVLGVFARPQTAADRTDPHRLGSFGLVGLDPTGIRRVGVGVDGKPYYAIPGRGLVLTPAYPASCLKTVPPRDRARYEHAQVLREPTICLDSQGGSGCLSLADIRTRGTYGASGVVKGRATITGLAPNGVRAVRVTYGRSTRTFPVHENFFSFALGVDVERAVPPDRLQWILGDGRVRTVKAR